MSYEGNEFKIDTAEVAARAIAATIGNPKVGDILRRANERIRQLETRVTTLAALCAQARECLIDDYGQEHPTVQAIDAEVPRA